MPRGSSGQFAGCRKSLAREDIAVLSNKYLLTLGHFFNALDSLDISYEAALVSKM